MKRTWVAAGIAALVLVGGFVLSVPHTKDLGIKPEQQMTPVIPPVFVHDSYKKGTHTLTVSVAAPSTCVSVITTASVTPASSSTPASILITVAMPEDTGVCLQGAATTTTTLSAVAPQGAALQASVNGISATVVTN